MNLVGSPTVFYSLIKNNHAHLDLKRKLSSVTLKFFAKVIENAREGNTVIFSETGCLTRQCCGPGRPFEMKIFDGMQREVIHLSRPLRMQICCCPCCLQEIEIQSPPGTVIGYVVQK